MPSAIQVQPLSHIKSSFDDMVMGACDMAGIYCVFVSGSAARDEFYPGWSDVDVVVVANEGLQKSTIDYLAAWRENLSSNLGCKVGVDFVNYSRLKKCLHHSEQQAYYLSHGLHFLKNFHEANQITMNKGMLYAADEYEEIYLPGDVFRALDVATYLYDLQEQVYETVLRRELTARPEDIHSIRIITKACLYLLQTCLLVTSGELITHYPRIPSASKGLFVTDTQQITQIYDLLQRGRTQELLSLDGTLDTLLDIYKQLMDEAALQFIK